MRLRFQPERFLDVSEGFRNKKANLQERRTAIGRAYYAAYGEGKVMYCGAMGVSLCEKLPHQGMQLIVYALADASVEPLGLKTAWDNLLRWRKESDYRYDLNLSTGKVRNAISHAKEVIAEIHSDRVDWNCLPSPQVVYERKPRLEPFDR